MKLTGLLNLAAALLAGQAALAGDALPTGVIWHWVGVETPSERVEVLGPERYNILFAEDGSIALQADCNRGTGGYKLGEGGAITIGPVALTRAFCPEFSLSDRFVNEIGQVTRAEIRDGDLFLEITPGVWTLHFRR